MNAVEKLQAAIDKLERLKAESTPGGWDILDHGDRFVAWHDTPESTGFEYILSEPVEFEREQDAELIVTLHRTIDAQIAILRMALHYVAGGYRYGFVEEQGIKLATAILGGS